MIRDKQKWGELAEISGAKRQPLERIASLYTDVNVPQLRDSLLSASDWLQIRLYFSELPESSKINYPAIYVTCPYGIYQQGNPGWHQIIITGYAAEKEPATAEMLWHKDVLEYGSKLLVKIREIIKSLVGTK